MCPLMPSPSMLPNERRLPGTVIKFTGLANNPGYPKSVLGVLLDGPINLKYLYFKLCITYRFCFFYKGFKVLLPHVEENIL